MNLIPTLNLWQWAILAAIPPAIIALYFLKLRRQPLEVPSTFLWRRTIEDLHVNSLWQRLRKSILLLLQILVILLVMFALLRPGWQGEAAVGNRFVILIDNSASMSSEDGEPTRLDEAKRLAQEIIDEMDGGDRAMIIAFNDRAVPVQQFTENKSELSRKLKAIRPTNRTSDIGEALRLAGGLANPSRFGDRENPDDVATAKAQPAELFIFTDGGFDRVIGYDLGNLTPQYVIIGDEAPKNVGITAFSIARNQERLDQMQAVCRIENFSDQEIKSVQVNLYIDDATTVRDAAEVPLVDGVGGYAFDLFEMESGTLRVEVDLEDDFAGDNVAYAAVNVPRRANVLLITPGNDALRFACETLEAQKAANIEVKEPAYMETPEYLALAAAAGKDLIIYDQCSPSEMPNANTLFIGALPPGTKTKEEIEAEAPAADAGDEAAGGDAADDETATEEGEAASGDAVDAARQQGAWIVGPAQPAPAVIDTDRTHPLMRYIELGNVRIAEAVPLTPPPGAAALIDADIGTIFAIAPRKSFEDAILGFEIVGENEDGERYANTDWTIRRSFPLFVINVLQYLGGQTGASATGSVQPGKTIALRTSTPNVKQVSIRDPKQGSLVLDRQGQATFPYSKTDDLGVYEVSEVFDDNSKELTQRFTVNLFDPQESNILPRPELEVGEAIVEGQRHLQPMRFELWKWILIGGLGLLLTEWWIWNRRVYL